MIRTHKVNFKSQAQIIADNRARRTKTLASLTQSKREIYVGKGAEITVHDGLGVVTSIKTDRAVKITIEEDEG